MYDLIIRGGTLVDGTGAPARAADVAIQDGQIAAVAPAGADLGEARRTIDATGLLVTPGWVDIHTHYDGQATWDPHLTPSGWNGVTTVVMGNCGVGFAPVRPGQEDFLIQLMEGVEDIPGTALHEGIDWKWESFPEYLDALEAMPRSVDIATQIPHGAIRAYVMGERGAKNEKAEADEIEEMSRLVKEGLEAGALGFSTSRTMLHRAKDGEVVPGTYAEDDELMGIGRALGEVGHGVFECASDLAPEGQELDWMSRLGKQTGRPVSFACLQNPLDADQYKRLLEAVDKDAAEGGHLTPQVAQRPAGLLFGFDSSLHPFRLKPAFQPLLELSSEERLAELRKPEVRRTILEQTSAPGAVPGMNELVASAWDRMYDAGRHRAPVAQLDRASGFEPEGRGFESLPACQSNQVVRRLLLADPQVRDQRVGALLPGKTLEEPRACAISPGTDRDGDHRRDTAKEASSSDGDRSPSGRPSRRGAA